MDIPSELFSSAIDRLVREGRVEKTVINGEPAVKLLRPAVRITRDDGSIRPFSEIEDDVYSIALQRCGGNMVAVAEALQVARSTVYRKIDDLKRLLARASIA